jgi:hypothetical protein
MFHSRRSRRGHWVLAWLAILAVPCALGLVPSPALGWSLTSPRELAELRRLADEGVEPAKSLRLKLLDEARRRWRWGSPNGRMLTSRRAGEKRCHPAGRPEGGQLLVDGAPDLYAMALGYHLSGDARLARNALGHLLDLVGTFGFEGRGLSDYSGQNQCILELALSVPIWIETASLLADAPGWGAAERRAFDSWLAREVYPKVAWASRVRRNNWGAAGSLAAMLLADYVDGRVERLSEQAPHVIELTPAEAGRAHYEMQLSRIRTEWRGDGRCSRAGIQAHGGIPDELRRGKPGCNGTQLLAGDAALSYQTMHVQLLVFHAEAMRRRGDSTLFDTPAPGGVPAILQAILFVIDNPHGGKSWPWRESARGALIVAGRHYGDARLEEAAARGDTFRGGRLLPYAPLTHAGWSAGAASGEPPPEGATSDQCAEEPD